MKTLYTNKYNSPLVQVDVARLPAGIYFININDSEVQKFVKGVNYNKQFHDFGDTSITQKNINQNIWQTNILTISLHRISYF